MTDQNIINLKQYFKTTSFNNSFLISFEGIEGSGKSTQIKKLTEYFIAQGKEVTYYREPGGTDFGEKLRSAILNSSTQINPLAEANLFAASRAQLLFEKVIPLLNKDQQIVILDRFIDSSIAYQGMARGLGIETILDLHKRAPLNLTPHCTFYLKIDLKTSFERQNIRGNEKDYFEKENKDFYQKLIDGYNQASLIFPERICVIDGNQNEEKVHNEILANIKTKLSSL